MYNLKAIAAVLICIAMLYTAEAILISIAQEATNTIRVIRLNSLKAH